jgi:hypothetical protein
VRVIGASRNLPPLALTASATLAVEAGTAVEQSITTVPGRNADNAPLSPSITASTCGVPVTHRISTSTCAASAATSATDVAPAFSRASIGWLPACSSTVRWWPCFTMLLAMPWPIRPTPTRPTLRGVCCSVVVM